MGAMRVAFVGVGAIGLPIAERIAAAGFSLTAIDSSPQRRATAAARGLTVARSFEPDLDPEVVLIMVATPDQVIDVVDSTLGHLRPGTTCIVMATVGPAVLRAIEPRVLAAGVGLLDVPVTGGVSGAVSGTLTLLAAGDRAHLDRVRDVLGALGRVHECGPAVGNGQAFKLVNQLLACVHLVAAAEALAFAENLGLDPAGVLDALSFGAGGSWMLQDSGPRMIEGASVEAPSTIDIFVKDSGLVLGAAAGAAFSAELLGVASRILRAAADHGLQDEDAARVIDTYRSGQRGMAEVDGFD